MTKKVTSRKAGLKGSSKDSPYKLQMIGTKVLVEEEPIEMTADISSGLTPDVVEMLKSGKLCLPDAGEFMVNKFPFVGTILSVGGRCKRNLAIGERIHFARQGNQRFEHEGKQFLVMDEQDVHGFYRS